MNHMGIDPVVLARQCKLTLGRTDFSGLGRRIEGKVRDCYVEAGRRTLVAMMQQTLMVMHGKADE